MLSTESNARKLATADDLPQRLTDALARGRRSGKARSRMSPELSYGRHAGPAPPTARLASVLMLLFRRDDPAGGARRWHLPLTERPATLARHAGQISLPGGAVDPGESSSQSAIRELREELGVDAPLETLGQLAGCYVYASDFLVTPWIAVANFEPVWRPDAREVQSVIELPLDTLLDESAIGSMTIERGPLTFHAPCIRIGSARVWGATSIILGELADVLRTI
jgi:8-oxo-dGTP pyrophosphatase MutT (NUDIX family)